MNYKEILKEIKPKESEINKVHEIAKDAIPITAANTKTTTPININNSFFSMKNLLIFSFMFFPLRVYYITKKNVFLRSFFANTD